MKLLKVNILETVFHPAKAQSATLVGGGKRKQKKIQDIMLVSKPLKSKQQPEESGGQCSLTVIVANIFLVHEQSSFPPELKAEEPHNELYSTCTAFRPKIQFKMGLWGRESETN